MEEPKANATEELENEVVDTEESTETQETVEEVVENTENTENTEESVEENVEETTEETEETVEENEESTEATETTEMSVDEAILKKFGNICDTVDELVEMAKEGLDHRNEVISEALDSGVHSMGNAFNKDIFTKTFSNMKTKDIEEMGKAWETQAQSQFEKPKVSKETFSNEEEALPRVNLARFKTDKY